LERTTKQLKEAIAIAGEETAKCKAAKEVIKSLTAQVSFTQLHLTISCADKNFFLSMILEIEQKKGVSANLVNI